MSTAEEKVLELIAQGKVTAAEGDQLLKAMRKKAPGPIARALNPFERLPVPWALALGCVGAGLGLVLSRWGIRFDGALDLHVSKDVPLRTAAHDLLLAWPLVSGVLWLTARALGCRPRPIDLLAFVGVARLPMLPGAMWTLALINHLPSIPKGAAPADPGETLALLALVLGTLPLLAWTIAWLYLGYRTASGLRGLKGGLSFSVALIAAELLSALILHKLF